MRIVLLLPPRNKLDPRGGGGSRQRNCSSLVSNATRIYGKLYSRVDYHVGSKQVGVYFSVLFDDGPF